MLLVLGIATAVAYESTHACHRVLCRSDLDLRKSAVTVTVTL